jgi:hypothetical protein
VKEHRRARVVTGENRDEGAWLHVEPDPEARRGIPLPLHWWSNWKGLSRKDWLIRDSRLVRTTDQATKDWAVAFVKASDHPFDIEAADVEILLWAILRDRMIYGNDVKAAYRHAAGAAMEMHAALGVRVHYDEFQIQQRFKDRMWPVYTRWFGSPMSPSPKVYL